jgi:hypothetical protein
MGLAFADRLRTPGKRTGAALRVREQRGWRLGRVSARGGGNKLGA